MVESEHKIVKLPLKVPEFTTIEEVVSICRSVSDDINDLYEFPVSTYDCHHNIFYFDYNFNFMQPLNWCGFITNFEMTDNIAYIILKLIDAPNGRIISELIDMQCPIYACPIGMRDGNKLQKVFGFKICSL